MFKLTYRIIRGIIILPFAVVLMSLLNHYEDSQVEQGETIVNTQSVVEGRGGVYETN